PDPVRGRAEPVGQLGPVALAGADPALERGQLPDQPARDEQDDEREQAALEAAEPGDAHRVGAALPLPGLARRALRLRGRGVLLRLVLLRMPVAGARLGLRPVLGRLLGPGHLPLGAAAQRVLARVQVLDLGLLVAVAGRAQLVLPGVRVLGAALAVAAGR